MKLSNWRQPANKTISDIANVLVILNSALIPAIMGLPFGDNMKLWIIAIYNLVAGLVTTYKKFTKSTDIQDVEQIQK